MNIGLFFGGCSPEHDVSINSARFIYQSLTMLNRYDITSIYIDFNNHWHLQNDPSVLAKQNSNTNVFVTDSELCSFMPSNEEKLILHTQTKTIFIDIVFPVLHGSNCEDGTLQGLFELLNVPYVGCGVLSSAIGMDKDFQKSIFKTKNLPFIDYISLDISEVSEDYNDYESISQQLNSTILFVKPNAMGSSVGVNKVKSKLEFKQALREAFKYSPKVLVEKYMPGRELEIGVIGDSSQIECSEIGEIIPDSKYDFYTYEAKYSTDGCRTIIPAQIETNLSSQIKKLAKDAFNSIDCHGLARVDFIVCDLTNEIFINEINTMPGFTSTSIFPQLWMDSGRSLSSLIESLIQLGFKKHNRKNNFSNKRLTPAF